MNEFDAKLLTLHDLVLNRGTNTPDRTGTGTKSIFGVMLHCPLRGHEDGFIPPAPFFSMRKLNIKAVIGELLWFLEGSTDVNVLKDDYGCSFWNEWKSPKTNTIGPMYGVQWRGDDDGRPDQLGDVIKTMLTNPYSRRLIVDCWDAGFIPDGKQPPESYPEHGIMCLAPCHYSYQFNVMPLGEEFDMEIRGVELMFNQRSVDLFLGFPNNVASYYILLDMVCDYLNDKVKPNETGKDVLYVPSSLIASLGNVHIYNNHEEVTRQLLARKHDGAAPIWQSTSAAGEVARIFIDKEFKDYPPQYMSEFRKKAVATMLECLINYDPLTALKAPRNV